jgi:enoyl-CoA hydratase/carnithine racemase
MAEVLRYEPADGVVTITLNRPDAGNSISEQLARELGEAWVRFRDDPALDVAILTGAGGVFCLGADMRQMADYFAARQRGEPVGPQVLRGLAAMRPRTHGLTKPIICAVNGRCAGIGLGLVTDSDLVLASEQAAFSDPHVTWGGMSAGGLVRLLGRLPVDAIQRLSLLGRGEWLGAERAYALGLVGEVTTPEELLPRAWALAAQIRTAPQAAVRAQQEALWQALETLMAPAVEAARGPSTRFSTSTRYANIAEGATAFSEQRPPDFTHADQLGSIDEPAPERQA